MMKTELMPGNSREINLKKLLPRILSDVLQGTIYCLPLVAGKILPPVDIC